MGVNSSDEKGKKKIDPKSIAIAIAIVLVILVLVLVLVKLSGSPKSSSETSISETSISETSVSETSVSSVSEANEDKTSASESQTSVSESQTSVSEADKGETDPEVSETKETEVEIVLSDSFEQFLNGTINATFLCDFIDYSTDEATNYNGKTVTVNDLVKLNSFDEEGEPTEVQTEYTAYTKNDKNFLLFRCEPENYDSINTFVILEKEDALYITYVQESYSRDYANFGPGYFVIYGSEGAGNSSTEYWEITDDGSASMTALESYFGTGWIEEVISDYMPKGYLSSKIDYYSPNISQITLEAGVALDEGDDLTISFLTYKGYEGILGWIDGTITDDVKTFKEAATADGVTWVESYDSITDAEKSLNMSERCQWVAFKN